MFILLHEAGHVDLQTTDELKADNYAFCRYADMGYPLSESVKALTRILPFDKPGHFKRVEAQLARAIIYDEKKRAMKTPQEKLYSRSLGVDANFSDIFGILEGKQKQLKKELGEQQAENRDLTAKLYNTDAELKDSLYQKTQNEAMSAQTKQLYIAAAILAIGAVIFFMMKKKK